MTTNTTIDEVAPDIYRISTAVPSEAVPGGFSFNQYLIADDRPLLFHTGLRRMHAAVRAAIERVLPVSSLAFIGLSHVEADECGSLNDFLAGAPNAKPLCGRIAAMVSIDDLADRPAAALADGETLSLGRRSVRWIDTPHVPHGWECGMLFEETTSTLLCGDLFTQPGEGRAPLTERDVLEPSEGMRAALDYFAHAPDTGTRLGHLASLAPTTLACMHGSAYRGDGAALLRELAKRLESGARA